MEITWNELLANDQNKRIEILASIYAEYMEFQKYKNILEQASRERVREKLKDNTTSKNEAVEIVNSH